MGPRRFFVALLLLALAAGCRGRGKDRSGPGGGGSKETVPAAVAGEHFAFVHVRSRELRDSDLFKQVKDLAVKFGGVQTWEQVEDMIAEKIGVKPQYAEATMVFLPEAPKDAGGLTKLILIQTAEQPIDRRWVFQKHRPRESRQRPGFYEDFWPGLLAHFPDEKTLVVIHPDYVDRYLAGYARDREAWPLTPGLREAAAKHLLLAAVNTGQLPAKYRQARELKPVAPLLEAKSVVLGLQLDGKTFRLGVRGQYADQAAAEAARNSLQAAIGTLRQEITVDDRAAADLGALFGPVKEAGRALADATVEVSGPELTGSTSYSADFDLAGIVDAAVRKVRNAASRVDSLNNLKQIGLALHNYHEANRRLPIHGLGPAGRPIRDLKEQPLLSWRVAILPFVEEEALYRQFKLDEPWDGPHNKKLVGKMPRVFQPAGKGEAGHTHLQMVIGPRAMRPGFNLQRLSASDGTSNTIAVVEAARGVVWTRPDDVLVPGEMPADLKKRFGAAGAGGCSLLLWDGSVRTVDLRRLSDRTLWALITPDAGDTPGPDW